MSRSSVSHETAASAATGRVTKAVRRVRAVRSRPQPFVVERVDDEQPFSWGEWLRSPETLGMMTSLGLHILLMLALGLTVYNTMQRPKPLTTRMSDSDGEVVDLELLNPIVEADAAPNEELNPPAPIPTPVGSIPQPRLPQDFMPSNAAAGGASGVSGEALGFTVPQGAKVVTKGSFAAWTVPEDPDVQEDYKIIVQVRLPKTMRRYPRKDLTGQVVGTDKYIQNIPGPGIRTKRDFLPIKDNVAQLVIHVPGAPYELVEDTITIRSKLLKEQQTLKIVF